jgi:pimeloyl-ACP methyl ester carboxylesterase
MRARVLYVPLFIGAESDRFASVVGDWAEVASFDVPAEGAAETAHARLDELGWGDCTLVADGFAQGLGIEIALNNPERFRAVAVGHAAPRFSTQRPRPALHPEVIAAATQLLETDYMAFWRAVTQLTQGGMPDAWVERWAASVPRERARAVFLGIAEAEPPACERLVDFDGTLLLAQHVDCVLWTAEGFEDAVAALPHARIVRCKEIPVFDAAFGETLRELTAE